jgi:type 1 fimbria pilin
MKKFALLPLTLIFAANAALAANSVDLRVTGTITPSACDVSLTGGDFNLGVISSKELAATTTTTLPASAGKTLNITCSGATQVALKAIDNRASSVPSGITQSSDAFGLGMDGANNPIGRYEIQMLGATVMANGAAGQYKASDNDGASWMAFGASTLRMSAFDLYPRIYALDLASAGGGAQPAPITSASVGLQVVATIQPESALDTSSEISLDGSATIELVYL